MRTWSILPSCAAITCATCATVPGATPWPAFPPATPAHVEPVIRCVLEGLQRGRLDRIDRNPLAGRHDANDAVTRHGPAVRREAYRQFRRYAADRDRAARVLAIRHPEDQRFDLGE